MADVQYSPSTGAAPMGVQQAAYHQSGHPSTLKNMTHLAGAGLSLALLVGVGVWGYKLVARDVSGIPVVRAAQGEMRVRPDDPGGELARNTGLAVNEVAALGTAAEPAETLRLAPGPVDLAHEDTAPVPALVASAPQAADVEPPAAPDNIADLVALLTQDVPAIEAGAVEAAPEVVTAAAPITAPAPVVARAAAASAVLNAPGVKASLRPQVRPAQTARVQQAALTAAPAPAAPQDIDAASLPSGTRLAQLGAYDSAEVARTEWDRFSARFPADLAGKDRVIQQAQSGGRTFFRLRAHGFADLAEARRFCASLSAAGQDCIPVVTR